MFFLQFNFAYFPIFISRFGIFRRKYLSAAIPGSEEPRSRNDDGRGKFSRFSATEWWWVDESCLANDLDLPRSHCDTNNECDQYVYRTSNLGIVGYIFDIIIIQYGITCLHRRMYYAVRTLKIVRVRAYEINFAGRKICTLRQRVIHKPRSKILYIYDA